MDTELESLEKKVDQLLRMYQDKQLENVILRQQLSETDRKNKKLTAKIDIAADKLEAIMVKNSQE